MDDTTWWMAQVFAEARQFEGKARVIKCDSGSVYVLCAGLTQPMYTARGARSMVRWLNTLMHFNDKLRAMESMKKAAV